MEYPKYLYHPSKGEALVHSKEEEKALGAGYTTKPGGKADAPVAKAAATASAPTFGSKKPIKIGK